MPSKRLYIYIKAAISKISTVSRSRRERALETKKPRQRLGFSGEYLFWRTMLAWCTRKDIYKLKIIATAMVRKEGVIEALKAADKMEWVRLMNSICGRADGCADLRENFRLDAACN